MEISDSQVQIIIGLLGAIIGFLFKRERQLSSIETKVDRLIKDVDGIALFVGTPRAIATKKSEAP